MISPFRSWRSRSRSRIPSKDEIGQVAQAVNSIRERFEAGIDAYNQTRANLNGIVGQVAGSAGQVSCSLA